MLLCNEHDRSLRSTVFGPRSSPTTPWMLPRAPASGTMRIGTRRSSRSPSRSTRSDTCRAPRRARSGAPSACRNTPRVRPSAYVISLSVSVCTNCSGRLMSATAKIGRAADRRAVDQLAGRVDLRAGVSVLSSPLANGVEVLEREAKRIHHAVAGVARRLRAMLLHDLAHRARLLAVLVLLERFDVGRRR